MGKNHKSVLEWLAYYEQRTGEYPNGWPGSEFIFDEERGFCVFIQDDSTLIVGEVCGNGRFWLDYLIQKAQELSCTKLRFWTKRNPAAFTRKFGFVLTGFSDGHYIMEKEVLL